MHLEVIQDVEDLHRVVWNFHMYDGRVRLSRYQEQERTTKRHKWRVTRAWSQYRGDIRYGVRCLDSEPDVPVTVREQAVAALVAQLRFEKWKR